MAERDDLLYRIGGDAKGLTNALMAGRKGFQGLQNQGESAVNGIKSQIGSLRGVLTGFAAAFSVSNIISATIEQESVTKRLEQTIISTGRAGRITAQQLLAMGGALQQVTTYGDEAIAGAQDILLTYKRIGEDALPEVTERTLDLAQKWKKDLPEAARIVGKALEAPEKATEALLEVGVSFTKQQREQVKALVEMGRSAEAQRLVLDAMEGTFGGAARAARDDFGGAIKAAQNALGDLLEGDGPNLQNATDAVNEFTDALSDPDVKNAFADLVGGVLQGVASIARALPSVISGVRGIAEEVASVVSGLDDLESQLNREVFRRRITSGALGIVPPVFIARQLGYDPLGSQAALEDARRRRDALRAQRNAPAPEVQIPLRPGAGGDSTSDDTPTDPIITPAEAQQRAAAAVAAASAVFRAGLERDSAALKAQLADNLISNADYYARKLQLDLSAVDQEISARRSALATANAAERTRIEGELQALAIRRQGIVEQSARDQAAAERKLADEVSGLQQQLLEATGRGAEARRIALERQYGELIQRLTVMGDEGGLAIAQRLFDVELARVELDRVQGEYDRALQAMARTEASIQAQIDAGIISERNGREQIIALHARTAEEVEKLLPLMRELAAATSDPEALARLRDLEIELGRLKVTADELKTALRDALRDGLEEGIAGVLNMETSIGDALSGMFQRVLRALNDQIAQEITDMILDGVKRAASQGGGGGGGGGADGLLQAGINWLVGQFHTGGVVGGGAPQRSVPALAFAGAPRYHNGGIAGLAPDERPAILKVGERVLTKEQQATFAGERMPPVNVTIMANDLGSFRRAESEVAASLGVGIQRAIRRNR